MKKKDVIRVTRGGFPTMLERFKGFQKSEVLV